MSDPCNGFLFPGNTTPTIKQNLSSDISDDWVTEQDGQFNNQTQHIAKEYT